MIDEAYLSFVGNRPAPFSDEARQTALTEDIPHAESKFSKGDHVTVLSPHYLHGEQGEVILEDAAGVYIDFDRGCKDYVHPDFITKSTTVEPIALSSAHIEHKDSTTETFGPLEADPTGRDPHSGGAKLDAGKPRCGLVLGDFPLALLEVAKVGTFGAAKYCDGGWLEVPNGISRYEDAQLRHYLYRKGGEVYDRDSKLLHKAHEAWNALASLELYLREEGNGLGE